MSRFVVASAVLVALVLIVAPVLAASPSSLHKVTWRGTGTAENGAQVAFSGTAVQRDGLFWNGHGVFTDERERLRANMVVQFPGAAPVDGRVSLYGVADVAIAGVRYRNCEVNLELSRTEPTYDLVIVAPGGLSILGRYIVTGDDFRGSIRMT